MKLPVTLLAAALAALSGCTQQAEESVANRFQNTEDAIENTANAFESEAENATRAAADALENAADAAENRIDSIAWCPRTRPATANRKRAPFPGPFRLRHSARANSRPDASWRAQVTGSG